jgi:hypothetical protein
LLVRPSVAITKEVSRKDLKETICRLKISPAEAPGVTKLQRKNERQRSVFFL